MKESATATYTALLGTLRHAYDGKVQERETGAVAAWKVDFRERFLKRLQAEHKHSLLEVGAGTGVHGRFYADAGLEVVATDLSEPMVEACRAKGLVARRADFLGLDFADESFDAVFAFNCILHVPRRDLAAVLGALRRVLRRDGLFFWGQYGGRDHAGPLPSDHYEPPRFFSFLTDAAMRSAGAAVFEAVSFEAIGVSADGDQHFQASVWRRR